MPLFLTLVKVDSGIARDAFTQKVVRAGNLRSPEFQKNLGILNLKEGNGHIISTYLLKSCLTWTKSVRLWERLTIEDLRMKWRTWMWTRLCGWCSWIPHFWSWPWPEFTTCTESFLGFFEKLFKETEKLIKNHTEIIGVSIIDYGDYTWSATRLLCDRIHQISNAKTYDFADSVLCLGGIKENPNEAWKEKIKWYFESNHLKDLTRIDGEPVGVENIPRVHNIWPPRSNRCKHIWKIDDQFDGRIIFMSMFNGIVWWEKGNAEKCENNSRAVANFARRFPRGQSMVMLGIWWLTSQKPPIRYSVLPAPLKEGNYEAKEGPRRRSISTVANKTSN